MGITRINPLWVYSHRGEIFYENWEQWGREIAVDHSYAVVFAVEMDWKMVSTAPHTPSVAESALSYSKGAWISTQLAAFIANLGYAATANHSRHYDLLLTPAAVDAGLGELGRFGYLITKELGPRVRIFAVTTDLPMVCDQPVDIGVEDFCRFCKKVRILLPLRFHSRRRTTGSQRKPAMEAECGNLFRLLGQGRHRLQHLYAGLPLEPSAHLSPPGRYFTGSAQQMGPSALFSDG